jgi:hypothetical protein
MAAAEPNYGANTMNVPLNAWNGSVATEEQTKKLDEFNAASARQTKSIIGLTRALVALTIVMTVLVAIQVWVTIDPPNFHNAIIKDWQPMGP